MMKLDDSIDESYDSASMDREHAAQLSLLNDVKAAVRNGAPETLVITLLDELVENTNLHFISEQLAMKLHAYERFESHFLEHQRLMAELQNLKRSLAEGTTTDKQSLIEALRNWLVVHIQTADKAFADYLGPRSPQPNS